MYTQIPQNETGIHENHEKTLRTWAKAALTNACGFTNKLGETSNLLQDVDILGITESWLHDHQIWQKGNYGDFGWHQLDRNDGRRGGGILLLVRKHLQQYTASRLGTPNIQALHCVIGNSAPKLSIILVYRSPASAPSEDERLVNFLAEVIQRMERIVIMGDFNAPEVNWDRLTASTDSFGERLLELVGSEVLTQHVNFDTRMREGQRPSLLDLVITKNVQDIRDMTPQCPLGRSDHIVIGFQIRLEWSPMAEKWGRKWSKINDKEVIEMARKCNWEVEVNNLDEQWVNLKQNLLHITNILAPTVRLKSKNGPPWWNARAKKVTHKKRSSWKALMMKGGYKSWRNYRRVTEEATVTIRNIRLNYEEHLAAKAKVAPKLYYNYVRSKKGMSAEEGPLRDANGTEVIEAVEKAELLASTFEKVHRIDKGLSIPTVDPVMEGTLMTCPPITALEVERVLANLDRNKSAGPDGIHPSILKPLKDLIKEPLVDLFNASLDYHTMADDWRKAHIIPIHKGGDVRLPENYRPISLTSVVLKAMERIIRDRIVEYVTRNHILWDHQHGFVQGGSCMTNLLAFMDAVTQRLDEGREVIICYLDFKKAFDSVNHRYLIEKLKGLGINEKVVNWVKEFLANRSFSVVYKGHVSTRHRAVSGVPQGSVLGPLLFLIYINDLPSRLTAPLFGYADDVKLLGDNELATFQENLNHIVKWALDWDLPLNLNKCTLLTMSAQAEQDVKLRDEKGHLHSIQKVTVQRDLGVYMSADFSVSDQCAEAAKKASRALHQLKSTVASRKQEIFLPLYIAYVRPHLEYCVQVWSPSLKQDIFVLERVQRWATAMIEGMKGLEYTERLARLGLFSLARRRLRGDLIWTFKIVKGMTNIVPNSIFSFREDSRLRGHTLTLKKERPHTSERANFFSYRVVNYWNRLPQSVINARSVDVFKRELDTIWDVIFPDLQ